MNFQTKIIIFILGLILFSIAILTIICSTYFFYALTRKGLSKMKKKILTFKNIPSAESFKPFIDHNWFKNHNASQLHITSYDNLKLSGIFVRNAKPSKNIVILSHGYTASASAMLCYTSYYYNKGFNILSVDNRCHGESEGKYLGMGYLDHFDILKWIDKSKEILGNDCKIILHGVSMGAATVLMASGDELPQNVKAIIADSGYTSVWDIFASEAKARFGIPAFPVLNMFQVVAKIRAGYDIKKASALEQVKKSNTPILFIHGDKDDFVPESMCEKLYDSANCIKEKLIISGAGHTDSKYKEPNTYYNKIFEFIDKVEK